MAPIRRKRGVPSELEYPSDDPFAQHFEDLNYDIYKHVREMRNCIQSLKTDLHLVEPETQRKSQSVADRELISCCNCKTLTATMVCYPCRHLCVCLECDTKISKCPMCNNNKLSSYMANFSA